MRCEIDVIGFLRKFQRNETERYRNQVPLLLFPHLVRVGCAFLTSAGCLHRDRDLQEECFALAGLEDSIIEEVLKVAKDKNVGINKQLFENSFENMQLYCNGLIHNFMVDFANDFGGGYQVSNSFEGSIEDLDADERDAMTIYFSNLGKTMLLQAIDFLRETYVDEEQVTTALERLAHQLLLRFMKLGHSNQG